ncbi:MAG: orotidine-5'-phosphate decarboxylase [Proteobacteria bacterium]|nr:orotidine-5'-phosphate decarboxylase [Pseudomonadota bacterium]
MKTVDMLKKRMLEHDTLVCCGLDPDILKLPQEIVKKNCSDEKKAYEFLTEVIDITAPYVCGYKAQKAFFDLLPEGHNLIKTIIKYVHDRHQGIPVLVDCKIGDTENTMQAYTQNLFDLMRADGIIINPYMGDDIFDRLVGYPDKAIVVLVKTSNKGGSIVQDMTTESGNKVWEVILDLVINRWNSSGNMIPVISSTVNLNLKKIREVIPDEMPILFAGVGAQGGSYDDLYYLLNSQKSGVFVNSSRGILYPQHEENKIWQELVKEQVIRLKEDLNKYRR